MKRGLAFAGVLALAFALGSLPAAHAAVSDVTPTDVTPRAFSLVWISDEPVSDASVHVFSDPDGTTEITGTLTQTLVSSTFPPALDLGIVKVAVEGTALVPLVPDRCVYVQAETQGLTGTVLFPAAAPLLEVCTEVAVRKADATTGAPLVNDLLRHALVTPDGSTPATGAIALLEAPEQGSHPISAFVGEGFAEPLVVFNLNNLFDAATGESVALAEGAPVAIREFRGGLCPEIGEQERVRFRRVPPHEEVPRITELEEPEACFFADTDCNGTVEIPDAERVLAIFDAIPGECPFNPDLDVVADDGIDILDVQRVLNHLGESAP